MYVTYIPTKANGYMAINGTIHSTARVAMRPHHSVYYPETPTLSQAGQPLAFVQIKQYFK
jgi:hypothetical protein